MHRELRLAYLDELFEAKKLYEQTQWAEAFRRLERAHILGQHYAIAHFVLRQFLSKHHLDSTRKKLNKAPYTIYRQKHKYLIHILKHN